MDESLKRTLLTSRSLPTVPAIAARILDLVRKDCSLGDLVPVVSKDPALCAKLIRYANSPTFPRAARVAGIKPAVMHLGRDTTVVVALGFSLVDALRPSTSGSLNYDRFWRRSLLSAAAARFVARSLNVVGVEDAFLAALLQDIGMMALDRAGTGVYDGFLERQADHLMLSVVERGRARTNHTEVGAWLLRSWHFPEDISAAVESSHNLSDLTRVAAAPTVAWCTAYSGVLADAILEQDPACLSDALTWADAYAPASRCWRAALLEQMSEAVVEVERLFEIDLATDLVELMNASKELMAERWPSPSGRRRQHPGV